MSIQAPGVYAVPEAEYHADPCPEPSLSSSIARMLIARSPMHAKHAHPRLNPEWKPDDATDEKDAGSALHTLILGDGPPVVEIEADDRRKQATRDRIAEVRQEGGIPILSRKLEQLRACADAAVRQAMGHPDLRGLFAPGRAEASVFWQAGATWCRARVDWLPDDPTLPPLDLKTTSMSAAPQAWERSLVSDYAMQAAFYEMGLEAVRGRAPEPMRFVVVECDPPYGLSVIAPAPSLIELARADVREAMAIWRECMASGQWPGYPAHTAWVEAPAWALQRQGERQLRQQFSRGADPARVQKIHDISAAIGGPVR